MSKIHESISELLETRGQSPSIDPGEALFTSGRLDSLAAVEVMMMLERDYGIDLADADFDISQLDTINDLEALVASE